MRRNGQSPLVSVCIPAYNACRYIEQTIRAVARQTYTNWELVIVENCSTDDTLTVIERVVEELQDERIQVLRNQQKLPAPENWNVAVRAARGEFVKLICADDVPTDECLELQVRLLEAHPSASVVAGARIIVNADGRRLFTRCGIRRDGLQDGKKAIRNCLLSGTNMIGDPVVVMWRRSAMEKVGFFDPSVVYCTDMEMWLRFLEVGDLYFTTQPVGYYRIHGLAAARGLRNIVVRDFLHTASLLEKRGSVKFTRVDRILIAVKSYLKGMCRQWLYRWFGGGNL